MLSVLALPSSVKLIFPSPRHLSGSCQFFYITIPVVLSPYSTCQQHLMAYPSLALKHSVLLELRVHTLLVFSYNATYFSDCTSPLMSSSNVMGSNTISMLVVLKFLSLDISPKPHSGISSLEAA